MKQPKIDRNTKEIVIQRYLLSQLRESIPNAYVTKIIESSPNGTPDVLVCVGGRFVGIEVKRPHGGRVTELQKIALQKIEDAGGLAFVVSNITEVDNVITQLRLTGEHATARVDGTSIEMKSVSPDARCKP